MPLKHPKNPVEQPDNGAIAPHFTLETGTIPRHELPAGEMEPDLAYQIIHDELMLDGNARLNVATFVSTWMEPQAEKLMIECFDKNMIDKDEYPQTAELEMRCVNILGSSLERAGQGRCHRVLDDGLERGGDARRPRAEATVAASPRGGGRARGQAEPGDGDQRPGVLGEVRQLLGRRDAPRAHGGHALQHVGRGGREALRREHHRCGRDPRVDVRRLVRAGQGDLRGARRPAGVDGARRSGPRRRGLRRHDRAVRRPRPGVGLPAAARGVDQHVGPQVRPRVPRCRVDRVARRGRPAGGPDLLGQLPRRQHADLRAQLLAARARRSSRSTTASCGWGSPATAGCRRTRGTWRRASRP